MSSINNSKRQRHESEYHLVTLSAVAAAKSIAESTSISLKSPRPQQGVKKDAKSKTSKRDDNQLHPMYGVQPFIAKLYQMINSCDRDTPYIAAWDDHGQTFVVKDTKAFASEIMPNYMQTKQFDSFIRNLNFYDFHKIHALPIPKSARDPNAVKHVKYRHPNFQRDKMDLVREIKRSTRKVRNAAAQQEKEVEQLKQKVKKLEESIVGFGATVSKLENFMTQFITSVGNSKNFSLQHNIPDSMHNNKVWSSKNSNEVNSTFFNIQKNDAMPRTVSVESNSSSSSACEKSENKCNQINESEIGTKSIGMNVATGVPVGSKRNREEAIERSVDSSY